MDERLARVKKRIEVTQRQNQIIAAKLTAMDEMKKDLDEKLIRYQKILADLEAQLSGVAAPQ